MQQMPHFKPSTLPLLLLSLFLSFNTLLASPLVDVAKKLTCKEKFTTITSNKHEKYSVDGNPPKKPLALKLFFEKEKTYVQVGNEQTELFYLNNNDDSKILLEQTLIGNINLYSLHKDKILVISKSYVFLDTLMNVQSTYECSK